MSTKTQTENLLAEISATQSRIATGQDQSETTEVVIYFFEQAPDTYDPCYWVKDWQQNPEYLEHYGFIRFGTVRITHPAIMAGTVEEVISDFCRIVEARLLQDGTLTEYLNGNFASEETLIKIKEITNT